MIDLHTLLPNFAATRKAQGCTAQGIRRYVEGARAFLRWLGSPASVDQLTHATIAAYQEHLSGRGLNMNTIGAMLTHVRAFCRWLIYAGHMAADPTTLIVWPQKPRPAPRALELDTVRAIWQLLDTAIAEAPTPYRRFMAERNKRAMSLMYYAGLRIGEVTALRWRNVDLERGMVTVRQGKGNKDRTLPLHPALAAELAAVAQRAPGQAVVGTADGKPLHPKSLAHLFERWLRRQGIHITAHQFRHTFATELVMNGGDLYHVKELMGHTHLSTTERYLKASPVRLRETMAALPLAGKGGRDEDAA